MPSRSPNERRKAKLKRQLTLAGRAFRSLAQQHNQTFATLMLVLAGQEGQEVIIPKDVVSVFAPIVPTLKYAAVEIEDGIRVYLVTPETTAAADAAALPTESLSEMKARMDRVHNGEVPPLPSAGSVAEQLRRDRETLVDPTFDDTDPA